MVFIGMFLSSCYMRHPKYSMVTEVMNVQIGAGFDFYMLHYNQGGCKIGMQSIWTFHLARKSDFV